MKEKFLVIYSSMIEKETSFSYELINRFLKYYKEKNKDLEIEWLDLNNLSMANKTMNTKNFKNFFNKEDSEKYIEKLKNTNKIIFSSPMTNFNITATAKNFLDHILVPDKTFSYKYSKKGDAKGLLTNLKVQILTTQGAPLGWYPWGNHTKYLEGTWKFVGAIINESINVAGTKISENINLTPKEFIDKYDSKIKKVAYSF